ncbi:alpha/beta hydrolase family protein [Trueperella pecoris]|uniref:alpha/beta hydrolase family protein n=1 Tax=Trueperella pecoris TaxID=2733571 RepID=UPI00186B7252|nr:alpha/beta fold hydrolase [Trueperella pecoris]QOQ39511.1 S9 family peptidase [Trueperella pecoris]
MSIFDSMDSFIAQPRVTGLATKHGRTITTVARLSKKKDKYVSSLVDITDGTPRTLTRSVKGEGLVAIGERGEVYFVSGRDDDHVEGQSNALWMLPPAGEARVIFRSVGDIESVTATGGKLILTLQVLPGCSLEDDAKIHADRKERGVSAILHEGFPVRFWDHDLGPAYPQLFIADVPLLEDFSADPSPASAADGEEAAPTSKLPDSEIVIRPIPVPEGILEEVSVNPAASHALVTIRRSVANSTEQTNSVWEIELATGTAREVAVAPRSREDVPDYTSYGVGDYSPDGSAAILYAESGNVDGDPLRVWSEVWRRDSGEHTRFAPSFDDWPGQILWLDDSTLVLTAARRGRESIYTVDLKKDSITLLTDDDYAYTNLGVRDGVIYALRSAINEPGRPVSLALDGTVNELAELTPAVNAPGRLEEVTAKGEDGTDIRAWLWLPEGASASAPAPLLVFVHGGPWGSWNDWTWRWNPGPFVAKGYAVLLPDPAISTGYGQHMIDRGNDAIGDTPYTDVLALVDAAEARTDINGERTALLGGSYGGYMANWMAGHTGTRFSCIVSHASLWNVGQMAGTTDNGSWYEWMLPTQEAIYSPHRFAEQIEVPMLIIHGDKDYRVPLSQSHALWQALNRVAKVRGHKFLYFPDENHWVLKPSNSAVWYQTVMAFVDHHVLGKEWIKPTLL